MSDTEETKVVTSGLTESVKGFGDRLYVAEREVRNWAFALSETKSSELAGYLHLLCDVAKREISIVGRVEYLADGIKSFLEGEVRI